MGLGMEGGGGIPDREGVRGVSRVPGPVAIVRPGGSPLGWGGGWGAKSASSDSEDRPVLRLLLELIEGSRRWRLPFDRVRECRSEARVSASDESEVEQTRAGVGLPTGGGGGGGKPTAGPRPEPLAWSQVVAWGWGLPPCQVAHV